MVSLLTWIAGSVLTLGGAPFAAPPSSPSPSAATMPSSPDPLPINDYDEPPRILKQTKPVYPRRPFQDGVQGTVEIEFVVDETGKVSRTRVVKSITGLDEAALTCVLQWRFTPARKSGRPVAAVASAPVTFRITDRKR